MKENGSGSKITITSSSQPTIAASDVADYYPFGLRMRGNLNSYRFGYQGEFAEDETEETGWNSFEARMYDPVIGRWLSVDPANYKGSPYIAMGNNPIINIDVEGDTIEVYSNSDPNFNGDVLFILDDGIDGIRKKTTQQLYDEGWQWTTPDGKNYANLLHINKMALGDKGTKFFTVFDLIVFSHEKVKEAKDLINHAKFLSADWKAVSDGADGDLLVFIDKQLYWADAIGNIPFGFNLSRFGYEPGHTGKLGDLFSEGYPNPFTSDNAVDKDFIMRGYLLNHSGRNMHRSVRDRNYWYNKFYSEK